MLAEGGLTRVNGLALSRRRDRIPIRLLFGDLPAGADEDSMRPTLREFPTLLGVEMIVGLRFDDPTIDDSRRAARAALIEGDFIAFIGLALVRLNFVALNGWMKPILFFFDGDENISGSTFSESRSSKVDGSW